MWHEDYLIEQLNRELPGEQAHQNFYPYRNQLFNTESEKKSAAVGVHIYQRNNHYFFILIKRPSYHGFHSGQIAFPGGKKDVSDADLVYTARRESSEELGIPLKNGKLIRSLTPIYIPVSNFDVQPYIFLHPKMPEMKKNHEVDEIFEVALDELLNESNVCKINIRAPKLNDIPAFRFQNCEVWGATALILSELKELLKR